jgi:hypothetical protein
MISQIIDKRYPVLSWLRVIGNFLFILGYAVVLFNSVTLGIYIRLLGNLLSFPYFFKIKLWDMVTVRSFFAIIELVKLLELFFKHI